MIFMIWATDSGRFLSCSVYEFNGQFNALHIPLHYISFCLCLHIAHRVVLHSVMYTVLYCILYHNSIIIVYCIAYCIAHCVAYCVLIALYCIDIDECEDNPDICGENSSCENEIGSFKCVCDSGYSMSDIGVCVNINECTAKIALCSVMATCQDTLGSYQCTCQEGLTGDGRNCAVNGKSVFMYK